MTLHPHAQQVAPRVLYEWDMLCWTFQQLRQWSQGLGAEELGAEEPEESREFLEFTTSSIDRFDEELARTPYASDDAEMRKVITSLAIEGTSAILLDNIDRPIGGSSIDGVLTAGRWKDRELGSSRTIDLPMRTIWMATGNNLQFRSDVARRVLPIRLDSSEERPENRSDFIHPDLLGWTRENRAELAAAALTILRGYFVAGCPKQAGSEWGSCDIIRGAIIWAGLADPLPTRETANEDDQSMAVVKGLIGGLIEVDDGDGVTCRNIIEKLTRDDTDDRYSTMREIVAEFATSHKSGKPSANSLGYQLRKYRGRVANGFRITGEQSRTGVTIWCAKPAFAGDAAKNQFHPLHLKPSKSPDKNRKCWGCRGWFQPYGRTKRVVSPKPL